MIPIRYVPSSPAKLAYRPYFHRVLEELVEQGRTVLKRERNFFSAAISVLRLLEEFPSAVSHRGTWEKVETEIEKLSKCARKTCAGTWRATAS